MVGSQVFQYAATYLHKLASEDPTTPALVSMTSIGRIACSLVYVPHGVTVAITKDGHLCVKEYDSTKKGGDN